MRIGIDVGGTNTDAVLVEGREVLGEAKVATSADVTSGIVAVVGMLRRSRPFDPGALEAVMLGTTHFLNAIVEADRLWPTAAVRLGLPATASLPPFVRWPEALVAAVHGKGYLCHGGHEFDGRRISPLDPAELRDVAGDLARRGIRAVAIASVFSPVTADLEQEAAEILLEELPDLHVSMSHEIGRMGLIERENATIINAALGQLADEVCSGLADTLAAAGITAPLFLSQNDGTLMDVERARRHPVATFASGPTNSMRGAAFLAGVESCAVVDVGGTTTDVGVVQAGFPREAPAAVEVGGVRTNFRMPDVLSLGIGGGSRVHAGGDGRLCLGPDSVAYRLEREAWVFGGSTLTLTDLAVAAGRAEVGDAGRVGDLDPALVRDGLDQLTSRAAAAVRRMRAGPASSPTVIVGGGSVLLPDTLDDVRVLRPPHFSVANAIGSAIAQVGGEVDRIFAVPPGRREAVLDAARREAVERAVVAGAEPGTVRVLDVEEVPIAYLPGNATRVRVRAVGDIQHAP